MKKKERFSADKVNVKHSIRVQFAVIFIVLLVGTIGASWIINSLFLQQYYIKNKQKQLEESYAEVNELFRKYDSTSDEFRTQFVKLTSTGNISVLVADSSFNIVCSSVNESGMLISRLTWHIFSGDSGEEPTDDMQPPSDNQPAPQISGNKAEGGNMGQQPPDNSASSDRADKKSRDKVLASNNYYVIKSSTDPRMATDYIELWGTLENGDIIIMRTPLESIRESVGISNRFLAYIGLIMAVIGALIIWFITKKITDPILELSNISDRMAHLDFNAKYTSGGKNEIGQLGEHMNEMSLTLEKSISELKTANNELQRDIEKKEKLENMRGEFISNVSHELKTPIALVQGYAEGLKDNVNDDPESRDFYCDVIMDEADKMNKLVKNLLTLNQLEFGNDEIKLERFDITELINNCMQSADIMLKQYDVSADFESTGTCFVWGDEFKIEEVFINFFSNAIHYCLGEKHIEVKLTSHDELVRVSVFNTGNPIPEDSVDKIWDKFYKVDKARTREVGGSGVGLSIVKAIMDALNKDYGVINYDNGVAFWFELDSAGEDVKLTEDNNEDRGEL